VNRNKKKIYRELLNGVGHPKPLDLLDELVDLLNQQDTEHYEKENSTVLKICTARQSKQMKLDEEDTDEYLSKFK
jgi:hypothetical protein